MGEASRSNDEQAEFGGCPAPLLKNEPERLQALHASGLLSSPPPSALTELTNFAATLFQVPIALVSLVDKDRQYFPCAVGTTLQETPRDYSFCAHALHEAAPLVVVDTLNDGRFAKNPLVKEPGGLRFYAGAPIVSSTGHALGTLCILDRTPRSGFDISAQRQLQQLASIASCIVNDRISSAGARPITNDVNSLPIAKALEIVSRRHQPSSEMD